MSQTYCSIFKKLVHNLIESLYSSHHRNEIHGLKGRKFWVKDYILIQIQNTIPDPGLTGLN